MQADDIDIEDRDIPEQALEGLREATQRALASGLPVVLVRGRKLVRIDRNGITVLEELPPLRKVTARTKVIEP